MKTKFKTLHIRLLILVFLSFWAQAVEAQMPTTNSEQVADSLATPAPMPDKFPEYPGGTLGMKLFLSKNLQYPEAAKVKSIQGQVVVRFVINENGEVVNAFVDKSVHPLLDAEALRVVNLMPKWKPGELEGKPIRVTVSLPLTFYLEYQSEINIQK